MKRKLSPYLTRLLLLVALLSGLQSCIYINTRDNDIPPRGVATRDLNLTNFDQLAMGSAFSIKVKKGANFSIKATGELNDLDDLDASVSRSGVLEIKYRNTWRKNRDRMDIDIVMPSLRGVDFSGASRARVRVAKFLKVDASGASNVRYLGNPTVEQRLFGSSSVARE